MAKRKANEGAAEKMEERMEKKEEKPARKESEQNRYVQLQIIDQQAKQLQQYLQVFDQQLMEIKSVTDSLQELSKLKKGDSILAPLASGIFVKARLEDNNEVRVNVGSGTVVTKTIDETVKMLEAQEAEIVQYRSETMVKLEELMRQAEALQE
ncbi:MAG TPA: prefoldin subunit alpha [Candidatus Nanoarchaeia archaeon]|nr:prefoldin subunit alpha [Candidatus Nanoarchaeia archaeon]